MKTRYFKDRREWRSWLEENGKKSDEIWLLYYKKTSGKQRIEYEDAVREALCFGWIDSTVKKIDEERYAQRFTPRKPGSLWSASNVNRVKKLIEEGRMTPAGLEAFKPHKRRKARPLPTELPKDLEGKFIKQVNAWQNFNRFPPSYRRLTVGWVASAKKEETKLKRLKQLIEFSAENKRVKFM